MEVPVAALAVLLLTAAFCSQTCPALFGANTPTACCFFYVSRKIPRKFVDNYYETSSQCSKPGVIFQTKRGRQICADPGSTGNGTACLFFHFYLGNLIWPKKRFFQQEHQGSQTLFSLQKKNKDSVKY
ncbi:C-C Motif Chemokine 3-Like 1 [Manis pentadactyla]|nr:C-C Motif Chemokine 3-Like 1 [Manis pentadactyla]